MEIHLHLQETDIPQSGRAAMAPPPQPLWVEHPRNGMIYSLRFLSQDGKPVVSDVRVRPRAARGMPWEFDNDPVTVSERGLDLTAVHNTGWAAIRDAALVAMSDPNHPVWEATGFERWEQWYDVVPAAGIDRDATSPKPRGGRPPLPDTHWAAVAFHYVKALESGIPAHAHIRSQMREGEERLPTENWVAEARKRGFLTRTDRPGRRGGALTNRARSLLIEMGLLPKAHEEGRHS